VTSEAVVIMEEDDNYSIDQYNENFDMQISEVEILQSMFPGQNELKIDPSIIHEVVDWVNMESETMKEQLMPNLIDFSLNIPVEKNKIEVVITLPAEYPKYCLPEVYVRSNELGRNSQKQINDDIGDYLENETIAEEPCVVGLVSWLQENSESYFKKQISNQEECKKTVGSSKSEKFLRNWIYSHHIYSKIKRKNILDMAGEFQLTGFCLPGKPGVICVEGYKNNVDDWWSIVRNWNWKKIGVKFQEEEDAKTSEDVKENRIFTGFKEVGVVKECQRGNHMDMGEFYKFLEIHNSTWAFKEIFGIER